MKNSLLLTLSLAFFSACAGQTSNIISEAAATSVTASPTMTQEFIDILNDHRASLSLQPLILDEEMSAIAQKHADAMAAKKTSFGHAGFSERCSESRKVLGGGNVCAENVAQGQINPQEVFRSWMNSPGHRSHIEDVRLTHTGLAYKEDEAGKVFWTEIFLEYK